MQTCGSSYVAWTSDSHWRLQSRGAGPRHFSSGLDDQDVIDAIKRGHPRSGQIDGAPDVMTSVTVID